MRTRFVAGALALLWVASARAGQDAEPLAPVLARVADYVAEYQLKLAGTVGEERYRQDVRRLGRSGSWSTSGSQHREMRSDLLLVRPTGEGPWLQFRDVFEVDGKPVRDRDERLLTLFIDTTADAKVQAEQIAKEGARYNIGPVTRTINVPVLALAFFSREHQARSTFGRVGAGNLRRFAGLASEADVWAIQFAEVAASTLVRGEADKDLAARGRAWVDHTTGRVLRTELIIDDLYLRARIEVSYGVQGDVGLLVPAEMREQYQFRPPGTIIAGAATYSHFRQFKVTTDEKTKPPGENRLIW